MNICIYIYIIVYKQLYITSVILPRGIHVQFVPRCSPIRVLGRFSQLRRKQNLIVASTDPCPNAARHRVATMRFSSKWGMRSYNLLSISIYIYVHTYILYYNILYIYTIFSDKPTSNMVRNNVVHVDQLRVLGFCRWSGGNMKQRLTQLYNF
jgi:hypothetical protein